MFRRSDLQPIPCLMQQQLQQQHQQQLQQSLQASGPSGGGGGAMWHSTGNNMLIRSHPPALPSSAQQLNILTPEGTTSSQRNLRRNGDVDRILNKYGRSNSQSQSSSSGLEKDPDFGPGANFPPPGGFEKQCKQQVQAQQGFHNYWEHQRSLTQDFIVPHRRRSQSQSEGKSMDLIQIQHEASIFRTSGLDPQEQQAANKQQQLLFASLPPPPSAFSYKQSSHVFPFKEAVDGHLLVEPGQIAFESRKLCVLMSDPNNNTTIEFSTSKMEALQCDAREAGKHERILHEVRRALSIPEASVQVQKETGGALTGSSGKEIKACYSDSAKATDDFEQKVLGKVNRGKNADTHVVIGEKVFPVHALALETVSSFFDKLSRPPEAVQKVYLAESEVPPEAFPIIMDWIVRSEEGRRKLPKKQDLVSVYVAAKHLGIKELEMQCANFLEKKVGPNDPDLLAIWNKVKVRQDSCPEFVRIVSGKMAESYREIYKSKKYLEMGEDELYMLLNSDDVAIDSEMDVYESAVSWLLHDWPGRKVHTNKLMSTVRFGLLTPLQLTQINLNPETNKVKNEKDFNQVLAYGTVKSMIDDGLAFSILDESYKGQPEELRKYVEQTGIKCPSPRNALVKKIAEDKKEKKTANATSGLTSGPGSRSQSKHKSVGLPLADRSSSYTVLNSNPHLDTPTIDSGPEEFFSESGAGSGSRIGGVGGVAGVKNRSRSRIPTSSYRPEGKQGNLKRPASSHYQAADTIHELSKPKLLTNSSNMITTDDDDNCADHNAIL